jgi:hypothetical protein
MQTVSNAQGQMKITAANALLACTKYTIQLAIYMHALRIAALMANFFIMEYATEYALLILFQTRRSLNVKV